MSTSKTLLSTATIAALIGGAGLAAAGPVAAAPPVALSVAVPSMTMGQMTITIENFEYSMTGTITPGSLITVTNNDTEVHTVTADNGAFDVSVPGGQTATFAAPAEGGDYGFFCKFHGNMRGTLTVAAGAAAPTPPAPVTPAPAPSSAPAQPGTSDMSDMDSMEGMDQMGAVPRGGADTGAEQPTNDPGAFLLGGGLVLIALASGAFAVRKRTTVQ